MPGAFTVELDGLVEMQRALRQLEPAILKQLNDDLKRAAEPVATTAEVLALNKIRNMRKSPRWSEFRVGSYVGLIYIAPRKRGTKVRSRQRPNLAGLLMDRAMEPALSVNESFVAGAADGAVGKAVKAMGF
jgi:hypothetical protein